MSEREYRWLRRRDSIGSQRAGDLQMAMEKKKKKKGGFGCDW